MKKHTFKDWFMATRPWSFPASVMPVFVTLSYLVWINEEINILYGVCSLLGMVLFQAGGNTWSDYYDYKKGVDAVDTFGSRILTDKLFSPTQIRNLGFILLIIAVILGLWLVYQVGVLLLWIGICGMICALFYPFFKYRALGDLLIFIAYAILPAIGTSYVTVGMIHWHVLWCVAPVGMITVAILHANNIRDVKTDARAKISTLAMKAGIKYSVVLYGAELLIPFIGIGISYLGGYCSIWTLMVFLVLPVCLKNVSIAWRSLKDGYKIIIDLDRRTAQLQLVFSLIYSLSFILSYIYG